MSDKKKLLEESQIRRMMKIAGIPALGETFIGRSYSRFNEEEEEEAPMEDPMAGEEAVGEEPPMDEPAMDEPAAGGEIPQDKVEAIVDAVLAGIEQETGVPLERVPEGGEAAGEEAAPEPEMEMGEDPMAGEEAAPEDEMMEGGMKYKKEDDKEEVEEGKYKKEDDEEEVEEGKKYKKEDDDEKDSDLEEALKAAGIELTKGNKSKLVNEVARRVARRLVRESKRRK